MCIRCVKKEDELKNEKQLDAVTERDSGVEDQNGKEKEIERKTK